MPIEAKDNDLITGAPASDPSVQADTGPSFDEPEGGHDTRVTTQPDYAGISRAALASQMSLDQSAVTGELGDKRDEQGRGAKNPPIAYPQSPEVPDGTRVIDPRG